MELLELCKKEQSDKIIEFWQNQRGKKTSLEALFSFCFCAIINTDPYPFTLNYNSDSKYLEWVSQTVCFEAYSQMSFNLDFVVQPFLRKVDGGSKSLACGFFGAGSKWKNKYKCLKDLELIQKEA